MVRCLHGLSRVQSLLFDAAKWLIFLDQAIDYIQLRNSRFLTFVKVFDSNEHLKYVVEVQSESLQCGHRSNTLQPAENLYS